MALNAKVRFYWDKLQGRTGSTLSATSTESDGDFDVDYLYDMLEITKWKAEATGMADPQYITLDMGSGNTGDADFLAIAGHNLGTVGATVSLEGINTIGDWTERSNPKNRELYAVTYGNGLYVAVGNADGSDAYIVTSTDGINWTERSNPQNVNLYGVCYGNGLYVAVGNADGSDAYILTSTDGINWTERSNPKNVNLRAVTYGNGLYVAVGDADGSDAYILVSSDGTTWSQQTEKSNPKNVNLYGVCYANSLFVAVGNADGSDAYIVTSTDGTTWTERSNPKNLWLYSVTYGNGLYVAVGEDEGGSADTYIVTSTDGVTWTEQESQITGNSLLSVIYGNGRFIAVGWNAYPDAYMLESTDGAVWTEVENPQYKSLYGITYGNNLFVAVGDYTGTQAYLITKTADNWTEIVAEFEPSDDSIILKEFDTATYRYFRLVIAGSSAAPYMAICIWGERTELKYANSFDPNAQEDKANVNVSATGYLLGIHKRYVERQQSLTFKNVNDTIYQRLNDWWEGSGLNNIIVAWDRINHASEVYVMRPSQRFEFPFKGSRRSGTIKLVGRK